MILQEKSKTLANNFPGDNNLLLEKQNAYSILRDTLEKAVENNKLKGELEKKYNIKSTESAKVCEDLKNRSQAIENTKAQIKTIEDEIKEIELGGMAAVLASNLQEGDLCPVCGSLHVHTHLAEAIVNIDLEERKG